MDYVQKAAACRRFGGLWLSALVIVGWLAPAPLRSEVCYLRLGPPPLRFMQSSDKAPVFPPLFPDKNPTANSNSLEHAAGRSSTTNTQSSATTLALSNPIAPQAGIESMDLSVLSSTNVANLGSNPLSASDLLIVTPQMLAEYLRPILGSTNRPMPAAVPNGEMLFLPPTPKPPSSEAIYQSK